MNESHKTQIQIKNKIIEELKAKLNEQESMKRPNNKKINYIIKKIHEESNTEKFTPNEKISKDDFIKMIIGSENASTLFEHHKKREGGEPGYYDQSKKAGGVG